MIKVVIVEDDEHILETLKILFTGLSNIEIAGAYTSGEKAIERIPDICPDVAIVDIQLHEIDVSGIDVVKSIKITSPNTEALIFTKFDDDKHLFSALKAGAVGYLLKDSTPLEILEAIEEVYKGGAPMSRRIARRVLNDFHNEHKNNRDDIFLTKREKEILREISNGISSKTIGKKLFISYECVRSHLKNIYKKLHAKSKIEAINKAKEKGLFG